MSSSPSKLNCRNTATFSDDFNPLTALVESDRWVERSLLWTTSVMSSLKCSYCEQKIRATRRKKYCRKEISFPV